jgi:arylsulfatase A-like enzyme
VLDDGYQDDAVRLNRQAGHAPAGPFRGGKYSILEGGTRVGLIVRWPGRAPAGQVSSALLSQVDLPAVFTRVAGGDPAEFLKLDARDITSALSGGAGRRFLLSATQDNLVSIRDERWKFIPASGGAGASQKAAPRAGGPVVDLLGTPADVERDRREQRGPRLFDLLADPAETRNLAEANPEKVAELKAELAAERAKGVGQPLPR